MGLKEQLVADYKEAMKNKDTIRKNTVNMVRAAIKQFEVDQRVELEDDADIVKIIKKQVKMRTDALADFAKAGRDDMTETYKKEIEILQKMRPGQVQLEIGVQSFNEDTLRAINRRMDKESLPEESGMCFLTIQEKIR